MYWNIVCARLSTNNLRTDCPFLIMTLSNGNIFRVTGPLSGNHRSPVNSPHKGQWRGALMFSLVCAWINDWVNKREAGDLRRHRAHYDVTVMFSYLLMARINSLQVAGINSSLNYDPEIYRNGYVIIRCLWNSLRHITWSYLQFRYKDW